MTDIRRLNRRLSPKGLCLLPLRFLPGQALLYLYRPAGLRRDLRDVQASELLRQAGYGDESCERCVARLVCRFREDKEFPHEVGLFLSYPPEDVKGFIDHRANDFKCAGLNLVCESVICADAPDDAALEACRALGKALVE